MRRAHVIVYLSRNYFSQSNTPFLELVTVRPVINDTKTCLCPDNLCPARGSLAISDLARG